MTKILHAACKGATVLAMTLGVIAQTSCINKWVDDDLSDCDNNYQLDYELRLVTNMTTELQTQLSMQTDIALSAALKTQLSNIFTDFAHDVDLSFYDTQGDSLRLQHDEHIMDANQASYTLNLPKRQYMHLAAANVVDNPVVDITDDERCHTATLRQLMTAGQGDTIPSHNTGIFTARQPMEVLEGIDQTFNVRLYMANCAAALVIDPRGHDVSTMCVYATGFATAFNIGDSTYTYTEHPPIVRTQEVTKTADGQLCFLSVNFPSRDTRDNTSRQQNGVTRTIIETTEPFIAEPGEELWQFKIYITLDDGSTTETILGLREPLRAGQMKIVKAYVGDNGAVATADETVGVSVTLDWNEIDFPDVPL